MTENIYADRETLMISTLTISAMLAAANKTADLHLHQIAASELAVDREIEQRPISQTAPLIRVESDLQICFGFGARFAPTVLPTFQTGRLAAVDSVSGISIIILRWPDWPSGERFA